MAGAAARRANSCASASAASPAAVGTGTTAWRPAGSGTGRLWASLAGESGGDSGIAMRAFRAPPRKASRKIPSGAISALIAPNSAPPMAQTARTMELASITKPCAPSSPPNSQPASPADITQAAYARLTRVTPRQVNNSVPWPGSSAKLGRGIGYQATSPEAIRISLEEAQFSWHEPLGLSPSADAIDARRAMSRLALAYHPDKGTREQITRVNAAYERARATGQHGPCRNDPPPRPQLAQASTEASKPQTQSQTRKTDTCV